MIDIYPYVSFTLFISIYLWLINYCVTRINRVEIKIAFGILTIWIFGVLSVFYGWRLIDAEHGGLDTVAYQSIFNSLSQNFSEGVLTQRIEKGYATFMWLIKKINNDFSLFLFTYFFVLLFLYKKITHYISLNYFSLLSYFLIALFLIDSFNLSRMVLGVFILFLSVVALSDNKYLKSIFLVLVASSIQMVCIWGFVFIGYKYFYEKIENKKVFYTYYLISLASSFLLVQLFKSILMVINYGHYVVDESDGLSLLNYIYAFILIVFYFLTDSKFKITNNITKQIFYLLPTIFYIVPLYMAIPIAYRFNYIYILFFVFIIPDILSVCFQRIKDGSWGYLCFLSVFATYVIMKINNFFIRDIHAALQWDIMNGFGFW
ncbi:EpsG family protein [Pseudoalteromonas nigrifaciens]|uniref:EpsG family protein n=1 Tax=Pseudoalteromonas nigrifaciens TaxID=28109 RepID=UPI003FD60CC4